LGLGFVDYDYGYGGYGIGSSVYVYDEPDYIEPAPVIVEQNVEYVQPPPTTIVETTEVDTSSPTSGGSIEEAGALLRQGDDAFQQGRYEEARQLYARGLTLDESNGFAHVAFMVPHIVNGQYTTASSALRQALTLEPTLIDQPLTVRAMFGNPSAFDSHLGALRTHVSRWPQDSATLLVYAYVLYGDGDLSSARAVLDDLVRRDASDTLAQLLRDGVSRAQSGAPISSQPAPA
jgi:tetratricopeptide (TPR) repeat protein